MKNSKIQVSIYKIFDMIFQDHFEWQEDADITLYHVDTFPPTNIFVEKETKNLIFEIALAGYKKEDINVSFPEDVMQIEVNPKEKNKELIKNPYRKLHHGIREGRAYSRYTVPRDKYNVDAVEAEFKDGLLIIGIPAKEVIKPKKIDIK